MAKHTAAIYVHVSKSDEHQDPENQRRPLLTMAESLGLDVVKEYVDTAHRSQFQQMLRDVQNHQFDMVLVWSLERFSGESIQRTLVSLEMLKRVHIGLKSLQERWLDTSDEDMGQLLLSILGWVVQQEQKQIADRTKAGPQRVKATGKKLGRPKGSKDKKPRRKAGYLLRGSTQDTELFK